MHRVGGMSRDHRKLEVFRLAEDFAVSIYRDTEGFPPTERYGLQAQLRRAAASVSTNIVEGCARESALDYARFLDIAFASTREATHLIGLSVRLGFMDAKVAAGLIEHGNKTAAKTSRLRTSILNQKSSVRRPSAEPANRP